MPSDTSIKLYYKKAFDNMRRCLKEAQTEKSVESDFVVTMKHPVSGQGTKVMAPHKALHWCVKRHFPSWSTSTWKMVRLGYKLVFDKLLDLEKISEEKHQELIDYMYTLHGRKKSERTKKTSARRKKTVLPEHVDQVEEWLSVNNRKWGEALVVWLRASIASGLRPREWLDADFVDEGRTVLKSKNFKFNDERSYAETREIDLSTLPEFWILQVRAQVAIVQEMKALNMFEAYYRGCSDLLLSLNKILWPRRKANVNLYTGRHQFSANAKASEQHSDVERAAMMGHKTTKTSRERYGLSRSGKHGLTPNIADPAVLSKILNPEPKTFPGQKTSPSIVRSK